MTCALCRAAPDRICAFDEHGRFTPRNAMRSNRRPFFDGPRSPVHPDEQGAAQVWVGYDHERFLLFEIPDDKDHWRAERLPPVEEGRAT